MGGKRENMIMKVRFKRGNMLNECVHRVRGGAVKRWIT